MNSEIIHAQNLDLLRPDHRAIVAQASHADATLDPDLFVSLFTEDATFQLGGRPEIHGRAALLPFMRTWFSSGLFTSVRHNVQEVFDLADEVVYRAIVTYTRPDGSTLQTPYVNVLRFRDGKFSDYRIFIDLSIFAPPAAAQ